MKDFGKAARVLARNPIGIVALFLVLIYGFATLLVGFSGNNLTEQQKWPFVWFLVAFPAVMLFVFTYLVIRHHEKLYAPSEFRDERHFFRKLSPEDQKQRLEEQVESLVKATETPIESKAPGEAGFRSLTRGEIRLEISLAEDLALRALEEELGCSISREIGIPTTDGWINFDGAVARGEELVAIEVRLFKGGGFPMFQIEHLLNLLESEAFERFRRASLILAIVSEAPKEEDQMLSNRLRSLATTMTVPITLRMYRLNLLKARFGL